ncbi:MAG: hypothetical protein OSA84_03530 [Akkermansiaceae bacterium]|nr:hypothetical protein [Akkermansiaceae bacterium]
MNGKPWDLYDMEKDRSELNDLVKTNSEKAKNSKACGRKMPTAPAST